MFFLFLITIYDLFSLRFDCYAQVIHFLLSHSDTVSAILRNRNVSSVQAQLEETALLTGVISRAAGWSPISEETPAAIEVRGQLSRLEQVTLNLLPIYTLGEFSFPSTFAFKPNHLN